jgi:hypothetical protein
MTGAGQDVGEHPPRKPQPEEVQQDEPWQMVSRSYSIASPYRLIRSTRRRIPGASVQAHPVVQHHVVDQLDRTVNGCWPVRSRTFSASVAEQGLDHAGHVALRLAVARRSIWSLVGQPTSRTVPSGMRLATARRRAWPPGRTRPRVGCRRPRSGTAATGLAAGVLPMAVLLAGGWWVVQPPARWEPGGRRWCYLFLTATLTRRPTFALGTGAGADHVLDRLGGGLRAWARSSPGRGGGAPRRDGDDDGR